jgi:hypothetical protein
VELHRILDVVVLIATLLGGAAAVVLLLSSLVFDNVAERVPQGRWLLLSMIVLGVAGFLLEWLVIH